MNTTIIIVLALILLFLIILNNVSISLSSNNTQQTQMQAQPNVNQGTCSQTAYGCCPDGVNSKIDFNGSNCPSYNPGPGYRV